LYFQSLVKIDFIFREEIVLRLLQLHDRAKKLSWNTLAAKLRSIAVLAGESKLMSSDLNLCLMLTCWI